MTTILCPTRGGQASYPNQDKAIALAKERKARLIFLYVYNIQFLHNVSAPIMVDVEEEMDDLGEFLLTMAQEKAEIAGVKTETVIRHGDFKHAVEDVIHEKQVDTLIMGTSSTPQGYTSEQYIQSLIDELQTSKNVEVLLVREGTIVAEYPASTRQNSN